MVNQAGDREGGEFAVRRVRGLGLIQVNQAVMKAQLGFDIAFAERLAALHLTATARLPGPCPRVHSPGC